MKLVNYAFDCQFDFKSQNAYALVLENSTQFYKLTSELIQQTEGEDGQWIISNLDIELPLSNQLLCIHDFFTLSCNSKKVDNLINNEVIKLLQRQDYLQEFSQINSILIKINSKVLDNIDLPITYKEEFSAEDFVKLSNYKIDEEVNLLERLITYIDIFVKLKNIKVVVLISACSFLSQEEIELLIKQLNYMNIGILLIDNQKKYNLSNVQTVVVDEDLCQI